jgi:Glycosyl hydrolase family 79 C-terminal beta domain
MPRSFAGFSIEYPSVPDYFGPPGKPNLAFIQLLRTLGNGGVGTPTFHLGGNSADESWWNPDAHPRPPGVQTDLTPGWLSMLRPASEQTGARFVLGGNLAIADPTNAVSFVQAAVAALPPGGVESYEIGNEPDLYGRSVTFHVGGLTLTRIQHRPVNYDMPGYFADLDTYVAALSAAAGPGWPALAVGGFARNAWQARAALVLDHVPHGIGFFQAHAYPLNRCRTARPPAARWRRELLQGPGLLPMPRMARLVRAVAGRGVAVRVSELNTATCGGAQGVSDSFASALWATDMLFGLAEAGVAGVNFHTWTGAWYAPVQFLPSPAGPVARVRPLLYGMLLFDRAVQNGARLLRVEQGRGDALKVWATSDASSTVRVAVINKDDRAARRVRLRLPAGLGTGSLERLSARSLASHAGVTFAGQSFERGGFDGRLHGAVRRERVLPHTSTYTFRIPAASAALLTAAPRAR